MNIQMLNMKSFEHEPHGSYAEMIRSITLADCINLFEVVTEGAVKMKVA